MQIVCRLFTFWSLINQDRPGPFYTGISCLCFAKVKTRLCGETGQNLLRQIHLDPNVLVLYSYHGLGKTSTGGTATRFIATPSPKDNAQTLWSSSLGVMEFTWNVNCYKFSKNGQ